MTSSTWRTLRPRLWRHPYALLAFSELAYLFYFHIVASVPHSVPLFPWLPFGRWGFHGPVAAAAALTICLSVLFAAYGVLAQELTRRGETRRDRAVVFLGAALFALTLLFLPRLLSKDLFDYMAHARVLTEHQANPFVVPAAEFPPDRFTEAMGWAGATPLYGPAWASLVALLALAGGGDFLRTVVVFKLFFILAHLANGWLVLDVARRWSSGLSSPDAPGHPLRPIRAAAFYLWNPLVLTQTAGDAHNDVVVLLCILLSIWLMQRGEELLGAACAALSVMVKYLTAPIVLLLAIHRWRQAGTKRAVLFVAACAVVAALAYGPYLAGFGAANLLRPYEHGSYQGGLMMMVEMTVSKLSGGASEPGSGVARALVGITLVGAGCLGAWFLYACWRTVTLRDSVDTGTRLVLLYFLLLTALLRTSYLVWLVGLAALVASVTLRRAVAIFSCTVMSLEVLWVWRLLLPDPPPPQNLQRFASAAVAVGVPILYLLLHSRGWPMRWGRVLPGSEGEAA